MVNNVDWKVVNITEQAQTVTFEVQSSYFVNNGFFSFSKEFINNINFSDMLLHSVLLKIRDGQITINLTELNNNYLNLVQSSDISILPYSPTYVIPISNVTNLFITTNVSGYTESTLLTYTVPTGKKFYFRNVTIGGDADGIFRIKMNNVDKLVIRNSATERSIALNYFYSNVPIEAGTEIKLTCENTYPTVRTFEGIILGYEVDV